MRVLVTGNTGFKGCWLTNILLADGHEVLGVGLEAPTHPSLFQSCKMEQRVSWNRLDVRNIHELSRTLEHFSPDIIFHLAAKALVFDSYRDPSETFSTNVLGTVNLLQSLRDWEKPLAVVLVTSDKVYENREWLWGYRESDRLGGRDPYSASKSATELAISSMIQSFFPLDGPVRIGIARAGNVIGGGDWAPHRVVPDCIRSWEKGCAVELRSPDSTRPWQHVLEPLNGYIRLAEKLQTTPGLHGEAFNFGPPADQVRTVRNLVECLSSRWQGSRINVAPKAEGVAPHEAGLLQLNCEKAATMLQWKPVLDFEETARMTVDWYFACLVEETDAYQMTLNQIAHYNSLRAG